MSMLTKARSLSLRKLSHRTLHAPAQRSTECGRIRTRLLLRRLRKCSRLREGTSRAQDIQKPPMSHMRTKSEDLHPVPPRPLSIEQFGELAGQDHATAEQAGVRLDRHWSKHNSNNSASVFGNGCSVPVNQVRAMTWRHHSTLRWHG